MDHAESGDGYKLAPTYGSHGQQVTMGCGWVTVQSLPR